MDFPQISFLDNMSERTVGKNCITFFASVIYVHLYREMRIYRSEVLLLYFKCVVTSKVSAYSESVRKCLNFGTRILHLNFSTPYM